MQRPLVPVQVSVCQFAKKSKGGKEAKAGGSASSSRESQPEVFDQQAMFHQSRYDHHRLA